MVPINIAPPTTTTHQRRRIPSERLAELVRDLSDVPMVDARRAVHQHAVVDHVHDPLAVVAGALVHLRHQRRHPTICWAQR